MAATQSVNFQGILELISDVGESPHCVIDEKLTISGFASVTHKRFPLGATDVGTALGIPTTDMVAIVIFSHDEPFKLRLKAAEKQLDNMRFFVAIGDDEVDAMYDGSADDILLDGNGTNQADIEVYLIHKA